MIKAGDIFAISEDNKSGEKQLAGKMRPGIVIQVIDKERYRVVPITSAIRGGKSNSVILQLPMNGMSKHVFANLDGAFIADKSKLKKQIGECTKSTLHNIQMAMALQREPYVINDDDVVEEKKEEKEVENVTESEKMENTIRKVMSEYFPDNNSVIMFPEGMDLLMENAKEARETLEEMNSPAAKRSNIIVAIWTGIIASLTTNLIWLFLPTEDFKSAVIDFFYNILSNSK